MRQYISYDEMTSIMKRFIDYWYIDVSLEDMLLKNRLTIVAPFYDDRGDPIVIKKCTTIIWTPAQIKQQRQLNNLRRTLDHANRRLERMGERPSEQQDIANLYGIKV